MFSTLPDTGSHVHASFSMRFAKPIHDELRLESVDSSTRLKKGLIPLHCGRPLHEQVYLLRIKLKLCVAVKSDHKCESV